MKGNEKQNQPSTAVLQSTRSNSNKKTDRKSENTMSSLDNAHALHKIAKTLYFIVLLVRNHAHESVKLTRAKNMLCACVNSAQLEPSIAANCT